MLPIRRIKKRLLLRKRQKVQKRRPRVRSSPSLGSLVARGTSALLSYVPGGKYLNQIAQVFFRNFGWTGAPRIKYTQDAFSAGINWLGMGTRFKLTYLAIAINSSMGIVQNSSRNAIKSLLSKFEDARLISVTISVAPMARQEGRQGLIAISFIPFKSDNDEEKSSPGIPTFQDVMGNPGVRSGPADKGISITFKPDSPWIRDFHRLDTSFGVCQIAFYDPYRASPTVDFPLDSFNAEIKVSGSIQFAKPLMAGGYTTFDALTYDFTGGRDPPGICRIDCCGTITYADDAGEIISTYPDQAHLYPGRTTLRWKIPEATDFDMINIDDTE